MQFLCPEAMVNVSVTAEEYDGPSAVSGAAGTAGYFLAAAAAAALTLLA